MSVQPVQIGQVGLASELPALVRREGSSGHPYLTSDALDRDRDATANLADLVHNLCVLHGRHPGMVDVVADRAHLSPILPWLDQAAIAFGRERTLLAMLTAAAGPLPSTPAEAETASALLTQRHALETLATSDRNGCAAGAVAALMLDWRAIRRVLDRAAERLGVRPPTSTLPNDEEIGEAINKLVTSAASERAFRFGVQQFLAQQRAFWNLVEARASARGPA